MSGPMSDSLSDDASFRSAESEEPDEGPMEAGPPSSPHPLLDVEVEAHVEEEDAFVSRLVAYVAEARQLPAASIDVDAPLSLLGLDSVSCVALAHTASQWVGKPVSPLVAYRHQTIRALACYLAQGAPDLELSPLEGPQEGDLEPDLHAPVALVGIGCRIPGSQADLTCPEDMWAFLKEGGDSVSEDLPGGRRGPSRGHKDTRRPGAYLRGVDGIDAPFFGIAQEEAARLDYRQAMVNKPNRTNLFPCYRCDRASPLILPFPLHCDVSPSLLFCDLVGSIYFKVLEATWHALEDAGIVPTSLAGRCVGVYVGAIGNEFATLHATATHRCAVLSRYPYHEATQKSITTTECPTELALPLTFPSCLTLYLPLYPYMPQPQRQHNRHSKPRPAHPHGWGHVPAGLAPVPVAAPAWALRDDRHRLLLLPRRPPRRPARSPDGPLQPGHRCRRQSYPPPRLVRRVVRRRPAVGPPLPAV